jgi:hypothetical protein
MTTLTRLVLLLVAVVVASCGGSQQTANADPTDKAQSSGDAGTGAEDPALAGHREKFMSACTSELPGAADFCQCSWDVFRSMFSDEEMAADQPDPAKLAQYKQKLGPTCGSKIPESMAHDNFIVGCTGKGKELGAYCECAWTELRKTLAVADFAIAETLKSPRMQTATKDMVKVCSAKLPESVGHDAFVKGCAAEAPDAGAFCECAWKQLRAAHSSAEIFAGVADLDAARPKIKTACGKLHPSQKSAPQ